ncbi:MAG: hypothetical protein GY797_40415 [Deltaproteobacteria bacterium]|nr:hypothetical protein [Deltaproteobacteria bacterium]
MTLEEYRKDFEIATNKSISMPIAEAIVWFIVALLSTQFSERTGTMIVTVQVRRTFPKVMSIPLLFASASHLWKLNSYQ